MYSPFTPQNKFKDEKLVVAKNKGDIIDLKAVMKKTSEKFTKENAELAKFKSESKKRQDENKKLNDDLERL